MLYPTAVPFDKINLVLTALRGGTISTAEAVKAAWELAGYGLSVTIGDPDGPQMLLAASAAGADDLPLSHSDAIKQLEAALDCAVEAKTLPDDSSKPQASMLPFIGKQLALYLLNWIVLQLSK